MKALKTGALELKNYGAVKDGKLTTLGKKMAITPFELRHAKLVTSGIESGFGFETVMIALLSSLNTPIFNTTDKSKDIGKHRFFNPDGDYFAIFDVYSKWKDQNFSEKWCKANGVNHFSLTLLREKLAEVISVLNMKSFQLPKYIFREKLIKLICDCLSDNLCVYTGHFKLGYKSLNTGKFLRIHSSSTFCYKNDNPPLYIVYDYAIGHGNFNFAVNITPVPNEIVKIIAKNYMLNDKSVWDDRMNCVIIEPVGEIFIKHEILGKQGKKLKIVEDEIKKTIGCDAIIIDPNAETGRIEIYAYSQYLKATKEILTKKLEVHMEKLRHQEEETYMRTGNVLMKMHWGQGGMITKVTGTVSEQSCEEKFSNEEEYFCSVLHNYSINITWRRRLCKGMGFVTFNNTRDFDTACLSLLSGELSVCGNNVKVLKSRKAPNQLYIEDLLPQVSNEDLKEAVENHLAFKVENATIVYMPPYSTSQEEIEIMKDTLLLQFVRYLQFGNLNVHVEIPNSTDISMKAYLNIDNYADILVILNAVERDGIKNFQGVPLNYEQIYRTTIICAQEHYNSVKKIIDEALQIEKRDLESLDKFNKFKFTTSSMKSGIQLKLLTNEYNIMQRLEKIITDSLKGQKLEGFSINQLRKLFSHSGQQWLKQVEKATNCYILKNFKQKTLSMCGPNENFVNIMYKIREYLRNMEHEIVSVINIGGKCFSRQIIKTLVTKYGITFEKFIIECSLISVEFNPQYGQLTLYGTPDSIGKAEKVLAALIAQNQNPLPIDENEETCPVCLTAPTSGSSHRLEYCGHLYCSDCLKLLVMERSIPLKCCQADCHKELVIEDILDILEGNEEETQKLLYHSLNLYVEKNYDHVRICPTADCNMIYEIKSVSDSWTCPACMTDVCTKCNIKKHTGMSCDMAKGMKENDNYSLKIWMANNLEQRKHCPKCNSPIEKNGGCNHMKCWKCKAHLCWLCLQIFNDSTAVYDHLPHCSKNQRPYI